MKRILLACPILSLAISCTTLDQSFRLGAATGALAGVAATYGANIELVTGNPKFISWICHFD